MGGGKGLPIVTLLSVDFEFIGLMSILNFVFRIIGWY